MSKTVIFEANNQAYQIHPQVKTYALKDFGFVETSPGKFRFERHLGERTDLSAPLFKASISNNLSKLKLSTTTADGLQHLDISQGDSFNLARQNAQVFLDEMVELNILQEV